MRWDGWDGMGWDGMGWDGMGWDGMGWDGMGWDGMGYKLPKDATKASISGNCCMTANKALYNCERNWSNSGIFFANRPTMRMRQDTNQDHREGQQHSTGKSKFHILVEQYQHPG